ncbi:MAG TPA: ubiquinol-cytochrome c reductase iron-sulfur subunit [Solirubrobacteraceae bacterium]|nr:ubiquinol-cytochrome c reductase iron-sulfur subunit [Solirubrobacteraceae bacterium]
MEDKHKAAKSKYTADRQIPGAFEGETVSRRRFMVLSANGAGAVAAMAFTLPALGFALGPVFSREPFSWQDVGPPSDFVETTYATRVIQIVQGIGEAGNTIAYVRKRNPGIDTEPEDQFNHFVALSDRCMHLGCPVRYVAAAERFICPCHGGVYDFRGMVAGGPPVRPLDRFYTRLNPNTGLVELGPRYSVNSELHRFSPRDPGEPLDGIGQYLYPAQFDTSKLPNHP